jgi:hypothetical protein
MSEENSIDTFELLSAIERNLDDLIIMYKLNLSTAKTILLSKIQDIMNKHENYIIQ